MQTPFTAFNVYGLTIKTSAGEIILAAGQNITITPNANLWTISAIVPPTANAIVNGNGLAWQPPSFADADAPNNSIYYSTTASKLVYKDAGSTVHNLY